MIKQYTRKFDAVFFSVSLFFGLSMSTAAKATMLYTYAGNEFATGGGAPGLEAIGTPPSALSHINFTITGSLGKDRPFSTFLPISWTVSEGVHSYSSVAPPPNLNLLLQFATNSSGEITEWYVQFPTFDAVDLR